MPSPSELTAVIGQVGVASRETGFRRFSNTFNRQAEAGLIQVVSFQGSKWGGKFTVNLGIYVGEMQAITQLVA